MSGVSRGIVALTLVSLLAACGGSSKQDPSTCDGPCPASKIDHLVVIVQENHTFDAYFGRYCTAPTGSNPSCTSGSACCEAAPATDPGTGDMPTTLTDAQNGTFDPDHTQVCEQAKMDNGKMDAYISTTSPSSCGNKWNFAYADAATAQPYWNLAKAGALADHYFQPMIGQSSSNDMYLARAKYVFTDNAFSPDAIGKQCTLTSGTMEYSDPTIADLLVAQNVSWAWYAEGYQRVVDSQPGCPNPPSDCAAQVPVYPCDYDPGDVPFEYYKSLKDNPTYFKDYSAFAKDIAAGKLPQVVYIKGLGYHQEHPGYGTTISAGETFVNSVLQSVQNSSYASHTLILLTYDEGGGFFDHMTPPPTSTVDNQPYGTRIPLIAIGPFARKNYISHVVMEHSSIVKFIEWNWLGQKTGQLGTRDAQVNNIGSLLDPAKTGITVPSN